MPIYYLHHVSRWKLDEASGSAVDAAAGGHDLTQIDGGSFSSITGLLNGGRRNSSTSGSNFCRLYSGAVSDFDASTPNGFVSGGWVKINSVPSVSSQIIWCSPTIGVQLTLFWNDDGGGVGHFTLSQSGGSSPVSGSLSYSTWYYVAVWYRKQTEIGLYVSGNAWSTSTTSEATGPSTAFWLGSSNSTHSEEFDEWDWFNNYAVKDDLDDLFNGGTPLEYPFPFRSAIEGNVGSITASLTATFTKPTYHGNIGATSAPATASILSIFSFSAALANISATTAPATTSLTATFTAPTYTGSIHSTAGHATASLTAVITNPTYASTIGCTTGHASASLSATFLQFFFGAAIHATTGPVTTSLMTATAAFIIQGMLMDMPEIIHYPSISYGHDLAPTPQDVGEAILYTSIPFFATPSNTHYTEATRSSSSIVIYGSGAGPFKFNPTAASFRRNGPQHVIHTGKVKPSVKSVIAAFQLLTPTADLDPGEFLYQAPGSYLKITNLDPIFASILPADIESDAIDVMPTKVADGDVQGVLLVDIHQTRVLF